MDTFTLEVTMTTITCCHAGCGLTFAVPKHWDTKRREDHTAFFCPNGHRQSFIDKSEAEKLKDQLAAQVRRTEYMEADLRSARQARDRACRQASAARGVATKIRKRVGNGVCPCCQRSFTNLRNHMATQHPQYAAETE